MTDMRLTILNLLAGTRFSPELDSSIFPQGVRGSLQAVADRPIAPPEGGALLVLTEDAALAGKLAREGVDRLHIVYMGEAAALNCDPATLEDIWSPADGPALLRLRLSKLLQRLHARFEAAFYRTALNTTIDTVPDMLWYKRLDGIHMLVNDAFTGIVHKPKRDVIGKDHFYIWDAPRPAEGNNFACAESEEIAISTGKTYICDEPVKTREGMKQFTTYKTPLYDPYGNVFGTVGVGHDVTNFSNLGIELSILVENMPFPMTIFTPDWEVVRMNSLFMEIVGAREAAGFDYRAWKQAVPEPVGQRYEDPSRHIATREYTFPVNGETRHFLLTELEIRDYFDNVSGYFCTMQDFTYRRAYETSIIQAANTDSLTGMHNRRYMYDYLAGMDGKPFHLLYLDLDRFKAVNDRYGHRVGDEVLVRAARLVEEHFPGSEMARLGGDEFCIYYRGEKNPIALRLAIQSAFEKYGCGTSVSIGVAHTDGGSLDIDSLIYESDAGMYAEKKRHHGA